MERIALFGRTVKDEDFPIVQALIDELEGYPLTYALYHPWVEITKKDISLPQKYVSYQSAEELADFHPDCVITLGGDGTMLNAVQLIGSLETPIMGINLGRLGFLASIEKKLVRQAVQALMKGRYKISHRTMLSLESDQPIFGDHQFALNDFTLHKRDSSAMVTIHTYVNDVFLATYWADGIIIATPTGSTGYSLSCGGPVIFPDAENFIITPVAPHNLTVRPVVISDSCHLRFEIEGRASHFLATLDSRSQSITNERQLSIKKCPYNTRLIQLEDSSFQETLRNKLTWGKDSRN